MYCCPYNVKKISSLKKKCCLWDCRVDMQECNSYGCVHVTKVGDNDLVETSKERTGSVEYF